MTLHALFFFTLGRMPRFGPPTRRGVCPHGGGGTINQKAILTEKLWYQAS